MEIFKLNSTTFYPDTNVQPLKKYDSFIWTERYLDSGDFRIEVTDDISILSLFPIGSLITHSDTFEVMVVENHEYERSSDKKIKVTVSGRSFETILENRVTAAASLAMVDGTGAALTQVITAGCCSVAATIIQQAIQVGSVTDASNGIANISVLDSANTHDISMSYNIKRSDIYSAVLELLKINNYGIKNERPNGASAVLKMQVIDGADRRTSVVFYAQREDLDDAKYFISSKGYKNYASVSAHTVQRLYRDRALASDLTGLDRKIMYVEADDLEGTYSPATSTDAIASRGQTALNDNRTTSLVSATVSTKASPKFKLNYDVGDIVMVYGEFKVAQPMRVTEHILTVDKDGARGYPALSAV